ncbi:MAG: bacterioferritin [Alphaproteobacteria bacterium]|nr:bacterioferritin [Alphaproteobacteria bacterium]MBP7759804.1 bacterioferritin [Alphaproteobacteria bacterium]MBP7763048.1 bacterioferritin [Alphaproteobacteria bacterium]MBP7905216.1 bacterioferritin [Alphaproteobacteria bacterium]
MKGDKKILELLNDALKKELTAVNQYFLHARMLDNWGITKLGKHEYKESIEEMHHADALIQRILFLEGLPNLQALGKLFIGENVKEVLECDLKLEIDGVKTYREAVAYAEKVKDYVSRDLFAKILADEEGHVDYLETQLEMIKNMGLQNYIQLNSESPLDAEKN